ncbi:hypothetical protein AA106555_1210 [Neokomagataea thailandica NBRC 106555]|uniref:Heme exporter protein D n=1 Tax=Neokomagataea thailandica NBRC 106555 TaxID=1223520 RepID=A0ABQ0QQD2_9PROT|nr:MULTISPECIES: hypothetical protein [Neokomagataea]GBR53214.1 hypothetical protein AA106555_1210 [Neokomagataea thailandica NBRC 106555]
MMTLPHHWSYIVAAYGLVIGTSLVLGVGAALRLRRSRTRWASIDTRRNPAAQRGRAS